ncbi:MAG TPA: ABC transporter permease [Candidatus Acidoferrales bacterium]|nr:ABC transporter permease [Candidatus Acidoferrales bacterium]
MQELTIEAGKTERHYWADLWRFRELFFFLSWRDFLVRYKQTVIGILWAVLKPVLTTAIFVFVFIRMAKMPQESMPPVVFIYVAMMPWQFFSSALTEASGSLITNSNMISKIYFPRLVIPASSVIVCFMDFLISSVILVFFLVWYHDYPNWHFNLWLVSFLPAFTLLAFLASFGLSLWLAALNVKYRDFRYVVPVIVQFGFFASPVGYPTSMVRDRLGERVAEIYALNPMVGVINGFRWIFGSDHPLDVASVLVSVTVSLVLVFSGIKYFRATEKAFADII